MLAAALCLVAFNAAGADAGTAPGAETPPSADGGKTDAVPTEDAADVAPQTGGAPPADVAPQEGAATAADAQKGVIKNFTVRKNGIGDEGEKAGDTKADEDTGKGKGKKKAGRGTAKSPAPVSGGAEDDNVKFRPLVLTGRDGFLELGYKYEREKRESHYAGTTWDSSENEFRETAHLNLHGYMYHPRFVRFDLGGEFSGIQDSYTGLGVGTVDHQPLSGDYRFTFLEDHPYSLTLSGFDRQEEVDSIYAPSYLLDTQNNSASFRLRDGPLPFELSYSHQRNHGMGSGSDINDTTDTLSFDSQYEINGQSRGEIYFYQDNVDQDTFNTKIRTRQFRVENTTYFDSDQHIALRSHAAVYDYSGSADVREFDVREVLDWRHSGRLWSLYEFDWTRNDVQGQSADSFHARASVTHRLYESLVSTGEVYGQYFDGTVGSSSVVGASITETYDKELSDAVDLRLTLHGFVERRETSPQSGTAWVVNEPHSMRRTQPSQLAHLDVVTESITVRNTSGSRQYYIYTDYVVIQRGHITEIQPTVSGKITEGETVSVTYYYELPSAYSVTATGQETGGSLQFWKVLSVYSRYMTTNEGVSGNNPLETPLDSFNRLVIGSSLVWKRIRAMIEYGDLDSNLQPETALMENASIESNPWRGIQTMLSLGHASKDFSANGDMELYSVNGNVASKIGRRGLASLEADYSRERWDQSHANYDRDTYYVKMGYEWRYRDLSAKVSARYTEADQHGEKEHWQRVDVVLRRDF